MPWLGYAPSGCRTHHQSSPVGRSLVRSPPVAGLYRIPRGAARPWPNQALVRRGDVTLWLAPEVIAAWTPRQTGMRGGQRRYSDLAIETSFTLLPSARCERGRVLQGAPIPFASHEV